MTDAGITDAAITDPQPCKPRYPRADALPIAEYVLEQLLPAAEEGAVAGSLRRGALSVSDIEIVLLPRPDYDMFGDALPGPGASLTAVLARLLRLDLLRPDPALLRDGPRYKRFLVCGLELPLDLFLAGEDNYGNTLAIRTGDAEFSRALVTHRFKGGLMPDGLRQWEGLLWARAAGFPDYREDPKHNDYTVNVVPCRTEEHFFRALGLAVPEPGERTMQMVRRLRARTPAEHAANEDVAIAAQQDGERDMEATYEPF